PSRTSRLVDQLPDLHETNDIDRQGQEIHQEVLNRASEHGGPKKKHDADDAKRTHRNDGANQERRDQKYPAEQSQNVRKGDTGNAEVQQAIDYCLIGDVVGVKTELDEEFFDPEC